MLKSLITEIKRQLMSEKVAESHRKFNKNLAEHIKNMEGKDRRAFSSLKKLIIAIGNFIAETRGKFLEIQEIMGKLQPATSGKSGGTKGGGNQERSSKHQKSGGQSQDSKERFQKRPRIEQDDSKPECKGCGRNHEGDCSLKHHPNWNKSNLPWKDSIVGKQFAAIQGDSWSKLPGHKMLSKDGNSLVLYKRSENVKIFSIHTSGVATNFSNGNKINRDLFESILLKSKLK
jgi:hypothetical protein